MALGEGRGESRASLRLLLEHLGGFTELGRWRASCRERWVSGVLGGLCLRCPCRELDWRLRGEGCRETLESPWHVDGI